MTEQLTGFGGLPEEFTRRESSAAAVLPVPYEKTSSWLTGSSEGPQAIINASSHIELYDIETASEVYRKGIYTAPSVTADTAEEMIEAVRSAVCGLISEGKFVTVLGGEHTVSVGTAAALKDIYGDFSILHLDAHSDMREDFEGDRFSHACAVSRMKEYTADIVSVGIRSMDACEPPRMDFSKIFFAHDIRKSETWMDDVTDKLGKNVFLNIDLDVFDPSEMPSTGTPEPGGLTWYEVTGLAEKVAASKNIIALDVTELMPSRVNPAPDFLAAKLIYRILSLKLS